MEWRTKNNNFNDLIKLMLHDKDSEKRAESARQLGFLRDARSVNLLCCALKTEINPIVVNRIIEALGQIGDGRATLSILEKFKAEIQKSEIESDKLRIIYIIESLTRIEDKRALEFISHYLVSPDDMLFKLAQNAFDIIQPNWREIVRKNRKERSIQDIFKVSS
ncbi:MAG: HEAT repeat domain-containing protein [Candidatus Lokiarchaeota archaeon]|nr:HEAT repeat domain-containing protein [Candidatus Lokiarchaeota archaeon]